MGLAVIQNLPKTSKHYFTKDNSPSTILDLNKLDEPAQKSCLTPKIESNHKCLHDIFHPLDK